MTESFIVFNRGDDLDAFTHKTGDHLCRCAHIRHSGV